MSYQEKKTVAGIVSWLFTMAAYGIYLFGRYRSGTVDPNDLKFWGGTILIFVGVAVVLAVITQIVFHILLSVAIAVRERDHDESKIEETIEATMVEDEMDQLIEYKALRIGFAVSGAGFIAALGSLVFGYSGAVMLNILYLSFCAASLAGEVSSLRYYRRGLVNG